MHRPTGSLATLALGLAIAWLLPAAVRAAAAPDYDDADALFPHRRDGRIVFSVEAPPEADVHLIGEFNGWDGLATPMQHVGAGIWEAALPLEPGEYQYKFVIDGRKVLDPSNPDEVSVADGSIASRIEVLVSGRVSERRHWHRRARRQRDWSFSPLDGQHFKVSGDLTFNRVDGTTVWIKPSFRSTYDFTPEVAASFGYGWESERVNIEADFAQPIVPSRALFVGLHFIDGTDFENQAEVGRGENTLAALLFKHDFNDYYEVLGLEPYVRLHLPRATLRLAYASEDYNSLTAQTQWSFFKANRDRFRPNPHLYLLGDPQGRGGEGRLDAGRAELVVDTRRARHLGTVGFFGRGFVEYGQGDFDYARWLADGRTYLRLGRPVHVAARLRGGARFDGVRIPSQKLFYVGGLGTVRGHEFRSQIGDRELLGNLEYTFMVDELDGGVLLFYDAGTAWSSLDQRLADSTILQAVGFGFRSWDDDFQINFAKPVGAVRGGIETTVRLNRTF
jgi:hypothetical protein